MNIRYDAPEVTKLRGMLETLRKENAALREKLAGAKLVIAAARSACRHIHLGNDPPKDCSGPLCVAVRNFDKALAAAQDEGKEK